MTQPFEQQLGSDGIRLLEEANAVGPEGYTDELKARVQAWVDAAVAYEAKVKILDSLYADEGML